MSHHLSPLIVVFLKLLAVYIQQLSNTFEQFLP